MIGSALSCDNDNWRRNCALAVQVFETGRGSPRGICPPPKGVLGCFEGAGTVVPNAFFYNGFSPKRDQLYPFLSFALQ